MKTATNNTRRNIETCGILAGKSKDGAYEITHLLIPKQSGTSNSCAAEEEETMLEYQDQHDLITLGWIHTHPTQTAFLSSVDLHTHCSYQRLLPEAIAIVHSAKFKKTGFYNLTNNGLDLITECQQTGFHPHHPLSDLFEEASHAKVIQASNIILADLRHGQ